MSDSDMVAARLGYQHARELAARDAGHRAELERLLLLCADTLDDFDRLLGDGPERDAEAYRRGVRRIAERFETALRGEGLEPIGVTGERADPATHHVVEVRPSASAKEDEVVQVLQRGYGHDGRVLRAARVVVAVADGERAGGSGRLTGNDTEGEQE
ncbi:nucleotide exchange factor GrpE [Streptomyces sp. VMFN-G11Ma]|uniref:nucleotide exchange factor GrpE n=2 Tax=Streptomyces TaxID=1883 RepID=UPI000D3821F1|nr:nucleotide exchange factor GrpE [Streptomyces sp. VMFN-G11Ma]